MFFSYIPLSLIFVFPLVLLGPLLASFVSFTGWRMAILLFFVVFALAQLISIYFSGGMIDYQFFVNLNLNDILAGLRIFKLQAALATISFVIGMALFYWLAKFLGGHVSAYIRWVGVIICVGWLAYPNGPLAKLREIYQITTAKNVSFEDALGRISMPNYTSKSELTAQKGKNIIVISLESFERGFLDLPGMTPKLNQLRSRYSYYPNMPMGLGSSWTTASLYTFMTGLPFLVGDFSSTPMNNAIKTRLVSLGDVLGVAGYQMRYVMANPDFAGMGNIIRMFGIEVVSEADYPNDYPPAPFGLYDRDIFDIAKKQVLTLEKTQQPFALFISTISTHAPNGFKDERMKPFIGADKEDMDFVGASLDYSVGEFIQFLDKRGLLDNTVFYIFPDHLMMGAGTKTIAQLSKQSRSLYLISNAEPSVLDKYPSDTLYQMDLPRLILRGANVETNATFLTDYLTHHKNKLHFIKHNKRVIAQLNKAATREPGS